ncbi:MAG: rhomboid family intramembrane serine protease [Natronomonas sp.]
MGTPGSGRRSLRRFPVTVPLIAVVGGLLVGTGITVSDVFQQPSPFNPLLHLGTLVFHNGVSHYVENMLLFVPLGVGLTLLSSDRHAFVVIVGAHVSGSFLTALLADGGTGSSIAVFALIAALFLRATDRIEAEQSVGVPWFVVVGVLPAVFGVVLFGSGGIGHPGHLLGYLFGWAIEAGTLWRRGAIEAGSTR